MNAGSRMVVANAVDTWDNRRRDAQRVGQDALEASQVIGFTGGGRKNLIRDHQEARVAHEAAAGMFRKLATYENSSPTQQQMAWHAPGLHETMADLHRQSVNILRNTR